MSICQSSALERPNFEFSFGRPPPQEKKEVEALQCVQRKAAGL